jgi:hypothetical protein
MDKRKPDWGSILAGAMALLLAVVLLWKARLGFVYHIPIYFKGPSWMSPWQALAAGVLCSAIGLFLITNALRKSIRR